MEQRSDHLKVDRVAACTMAAVHTRDHTHAFNVEACHPHEVEVVFLGCRALTVCHDCRTDTGFLPHRDAERLAEGHREQTLVSSVPVALALAS